MPLSRARQAAPNNDLQPWVWLGFVLIQVQSIILGVYGQLAVQVRHSC